MPCGLKAYNKKMRGHAVRLLLFAFSTMMLIPVPFFCQKSIGKIEEPNKNISGDDYTLEQMVGKKFIFLRPEPEPNDPLLRARWRLKLATRNRFRFVTNKKGELEYLNGVNSPLDYYSFSENDNGEKVSNQFILFDEYVGKVVILDAIHPLDKYQKYVLFHVEGSEKMIYALTDVAANCLPALLSLDDLEKAKRRWIDKTIYLKPHERSGVHANLFTYDSTKNIIGKIPFIPYEAVKVIDVIPGAYDSDRYGPRLWVIVQKSNKEQGFIKTSYSWTNTGAPSTFDWKPWDDYFFEVNPRVTYKWPAGIWKLIEEKNVQLGMTKAQAIMSWGKPNRINEDIFRGGKKEQWVYEGQDQYIYFQGDRLTFIQSRGN